jgi:hypothetical protein
MVAWDLSHPTPGWRSAMPCESVTVRGARTNGTQTQKSTAGWLSLLWFWFGSILILQGIGVYHEYGLILALRTLEALA